LLNYIIDKGYNAALVPWELMISHISCQTAQGTPSRCHWLSCQLQCLIGLFPYPDITPLSSPYMPETAAKDVFTLVPWEMLNQHHNAKEAKASKAVETLTGILADGCAIS
jgi:hypothetical protein